MKTFSKRLLTMLLAIAMIFSLSGMTTFAAETDDSGSQDAAAEEVLTEDPESGDAQVVSGEEAENADTSAVSVEDPGSGDAPDISVEDSENGDVAVLSAEGGETEEPDAEENTSDGDISTYAGTQPSQDSDGNYLITSAANLVWFADQVNNGNTNINGLVTADTISVSTSDGFSPIGTSSSPYTGTFDGGWNTITLNLTNGTEDYQALFGYAKDATISNVTVAGSVSGAQYTAGIVAYMDGGNITGCINKAAVSSTSSNTGGIVGYFYAKSTSNDDGCIVKCGNDGPITSSAQNVGGIAGYARNSGNYYPYVFSCYNHADIEGAYKVGGIIGTVQDVNTKITIDSCYNTGAFTVTSNYSGSSYVNGGIIGAYGGSTSNSSRFSNLFSTTKTVTGSSSSSVGAIVGGGTSNACYASLSRSYYIEFSIGSTVVGPYSSYFNEHLTVDTDTVAAKTAAEMQEADFLDLINGNDAFVQGDDHPVLQWELTGWDALVAEYNLDVKLSEDDYTAESWPAFAEALAEAKNVIDQGQNNVTEAQINSALSGLQEAKDNLKGVYDVKYAVTIYGISQDTTSSDVPLGLTFGPVVGKGDDYRKQYKAHLSQEDYQNGNGICLHWMTWDEIVEQSETNPSAFQDCLDYGCTHSVIIQLNNTLFHKSYAGKMTGDGVGILNNSIDSNYRQWGYNGTSWIAWNSSYINTRTLNSSSYGLITCLPEELRGAIAQRYLSYTTASSTSSTGTSYGSYYLWAFKSNEYNWSGSNNAAYQKFKSIEGLDRDKTPLYAYDEEGDQVSRYTRDVSTSSIGSVSIFSYPGTTNELTIGNQSGGGSEGVTFGFCLSGPEDFTSLTISPSSSSGLDSNNTKTYDGNSVALNTSRAYQNANPIRSSWTYKWYKLDESTNDYVDTGKTGSALTLDGEVSDSGTYKCVCTLTYGASDVTVTQENTITITINPADQEIEFENDPVTGLSVGATYTNTITSTNYGDITYVSDNTSVATVNSSTGEVTIVGVGTANITATAAGDENHNSGTGSYTIDVTDEGLSVVVTSDLSGNEKNYDGNSVTLTATPSSSVSGATYTYQWYKDGNAISGETKSTLTLTGNVSDSGSYTCTVTSSSGTSATSEPLVITINKANQGVTFQNSSVNVAVGSTYKNTITSTNYGDITYTVSGDSDVATVGSDGTVTITGVGTVTITATAAGDANHNSGSNTYTITTKDEGLYVTVTSDLTNNTKVYNGEEVTLTANPHSDVEGADFTYQWYKDGNAISGETKPTLVLDGDVADSGKYTCTVTVTYPNKKTGTAEDSATVTITIATQTISYAESVKDVTKYDYDDDFINPLTTGTVYGAITYKITLDPSLGGDLEVTIGSSTGSVHIIGGSGVAVVTATAAGSSDYEEATATYTLTVNPDEITWEITSDHGEAVWDGEEYVDDITYTGEDVTLSMELTLDDDEIEHEKTETYQWYVYEDGSYKKIDEAENASYTMTGTEVNAGDHIYLCVATVTYNNGYSHTIYGAIEVEIEKAAQDISYGSETIYKVVGDAAFTNKLTETTVDPVDGNITYMSSDTSVATVDGNGEVTIVGPGTTTITATAKETDNYKEDTASYTLIVEEKLSVSVTVTSNLTDDEKTYDGEKVILTATAESDPSGAAVAFQWYGPDGEELDGETKETLELAGNVNDSGTYKCIVTATYGTYTPQEATDEDSVTVTIYKADQKIVFTESSYEEVYVGDTFKNELTDESVVDGKVTYTSSDESVVKVDPDTGEVTIVGVGEAGSSVTITATAAGTDNYNSTSASYTISCPVDGTLDVKITLTTDLPDNTKTYDGEPVTLNADAVSSVEGTEFTFQWEKEDASKNSYKPFAGATGSDAYELAGNVADSGTYTCTVTVTYPNGVTDVISDSIEITINPVEQIISYEEETVDKLDGDAPFINELTVDVLSDEDGAGITYTSSDETIAAVDPDTGEVTILAPGEVIITATAAATANYAGATASYTLDIMEIVTFEGTKIWDDNDDQDGMRPADVVLTLEGKDGEPVTDDDGNVITATIAMHPEISPASISPLTTFLAVSPNEWEWGFIDADRELIRFPKYDKDTGDEIDYKIVEEEIDGYNALTGGQPVITYNEDDNTYTLTNTHTPETVSLYGTKEWDDADNQDGIRPSFVDIGLLKNGDTVDDGTGNADVAIATESGGWAWKFANLPKYENGELIDYGAAEIEVDGYEAAIGACETDADGNYTIAVTNVHEPETVSYAVTKVWDDNDDQDGDRPTSITVRLLADGTEIDYMNLTANEDWEGAFTGLPRYKEGEEGKEVNYTVEEDPVVDYTTAYADTYDKDTGDYTVTITNTHAADMETLTVNKVWDDADNQDGRRPAQIDVALLADGAPAVDEAGNEITLTLSGESSVWTGTVDVEAYEDGGKDVVYTVDEIDAIDGYTTVYGDDGLTVINSHEPETTSVTVTKEWNDGDDRDGLEHEYVTVRLLADNAEVASDNITAADGWTYTFDNLPKYADGKEITYTVTEDAMDGYDTAYDYANGESGDCTITNTHVPGMTSMTVAKVWDDEDDVDHIRPESVTVELWGIWQDDAGDIVEEQFSDRTVELNEGNNWSYNYTDLMEYEGGHKINYYVKEEALTDAGGDPLDYEAVITGDATQGYTITNVHVPSATEVTVTKAWDDADNQDGVRPGDVHVYLLADGTRVTDSYGEELMAVLKEENDWTHTFTGLPEYEMVDDGSGGVTHQPIEYTVEEEEVSGYTMSGITGDAQSGYTITNSHTPATLTVTAEKVWDDEEDQDGKRPESVKVALFADAEWIADGMLTADTDWAPYDFTDLPVYDNGVEIRYTVAEYDVEDYTGTVASVHDADGITFTFTNTCTQEETGVTVAKVWEDGDDQDGMRPTSVTVNLCADGDPVDTALLNEFNDWTYTFTGLSKYENADEITYTVTEDAVDGYETEIIPIEGAHEFILVNSHEPETFDLAVDKVWDDAGDQDGARPDYITYRLYADGTEKDHCNVTAGEDWSHTFADLPCYADGRKLTYTVTEDAVSGYTPDISDIENGTVTITNTHTPGITSVSATKAWDDADDQDGIRPESVTVDLLADGSAAVDAAGDEITEELSEANGWTCTFTGLPEYADGKKIDYTVKEEALTDENGDALDYTSAVTGDAEAGYVITNTHVPETIDITGEKVWDDADDQDGLRPDSIEVYLLKDGERIPNGYDGYLDAEVSGDTGWEFDFTNMPVYEDGEPVAYSVEEVKVDGYETSYEPENGAVGADGSVTITNTRDPALLEDITITKVWDDGNDRDGDRPESITVDLFADATWDSSYEITKDDDWSCTISGLPVYKDGGEEIEYTLFEEEVDGYSADWDIEYDDTQGKYAAILTNTHTLDQTSVTVKKIWDDDNDRDGVRPTSLTMELVDDEGNTVATGIMNEGTDWLYTFDSVDTYKEGGNGERISYTVVETDEYGEEIYDYDSELITADAGVDGCHYNFLLENSHKPAETTLTVDKAWEDDNDRDGVRPDSVTVSLLADGEPVLDTDGKAVSVALNDEDNWTYKFATCADYTMYQYRDGGEEIEYTVTEDAVDRYETAYDYAKENDSGEGYGDCTVVNSYEPETTEVTVTKAWDDEDDMYGFRPDSVTVTLLADGSPVTDENGEAVTAELASDDWTATFAGSDKYKVYQYRDQGTAIEYTVEEDHVSGYTLEENEAAVNGDGSTEIALTNGMHMSFAGMDEEIVPDGDDEADPGSWVTQESVNEYDAIQIEMSTLLPDVSGELVAEGAFNITFHNELESALVLDEETGDFHVYIGGEPVDPQYYTIEIFDNEASPLALLPLAAAADDCTFHVVLDLSALYNDGVITEDDLGESEVRVFFFADLETLDVNGSYTSTAWYDVQSGEDVLYTSDKSVVSVYTFELSVSATDSETGEPVPGVTFGIYYDEACTDPVLRKGEAFTATSGEDGEALFTGLAEGTYYVKETAVPDGYELSDTVVSVELGSDSGEGGHDQNLPFTTQAALLNGLHQIEAGKLWGYYVDGKVDTGYTGFAHDQYGDWYVVNGYVRFDQNTVAKDVTGKNGDKGIGEKGDWYYVIANEVQHDFTGLAHYKNDYGWWYIKDGRVDFTHNGVDKNQNGWWYVTGGKVQSDFTGLAHYRNENGWWYIQNGKVNFNHNGVEKNQNGWFYVTDSKVQFGFTGLGNYGNQYGWWYIQGGKVDFSHNGVDHNQNGWWYVTGGKVQFGFTGLGNYGNQYGWWYIKDGKVDFTHTGIDKNWNGWWLVVDGKLDFGYTGLSHFPNAYGWWYIKNGKVDFDYSGIARNQYGMWYVDYGQVDFSFNAEVAYNGRYYTVRNGRVS